MGVEEAGFNYVLKKKVFFIHGLSWIVNSVGRSKAFKRLGREFEFGFVSEFPLQSSLVTSKSE